MHANYLNSAFGLRGETGGRGAEHQQNSFTHPQIATLKTGRGAHRKFLPYAFTEHGVLMAAGVLNSKRAIEVSIYIVRTLVAMRQAIANHEELSKKRSILGPSSMHSVEMTIQVRAFWDEEAKVWVAEKR